MLSIIVPIYNAEKYLKECLNSLKKQTLKDIEVIMIDDGSTDASIEIAKTFACSDERFKLFNKSNGGPQSACNFGIRQSKGKYVGFVDSDDYVETNMFRELYDAAIRDNSDMVCCGAKSIYSKKVICEDVFVDDGRYDFKRIKAQIYPILFNTCKEPDFSRGLFAARWNKIYRRELLVENMQFFDERISFGEDLLTTVITVMSAQSITVLKNKFLYNYRIRENSISRKYDPKLVEQIDILEKLLYKQIERMRAWECQDGYYVDMFWFQLQKIRNVKCSDDTSKQKIKRIREILNSDSVKKCLPYIKKYYRSSSGKIKYFLVKHKMSRTLLWLL